MSAEVTQVEDGWLVTCPEHNLLRGVATAQHAANLAVLHDRKDHADDTALITVDLTACAWAVVDAQEPITKGGDAYDRGYTNGALIIWQALTGIYDSVDALAHAREVAAADPPIIAVCPPF